ncbi:MAG TPA: FtsX-like permease family protein, partial [Hanamia sp.]|nr:FtsX-like permease family protein [Hanamia sp.]
MKQIVKLAWRNLWRNKRRTFITLISVLMAVILAIGLRSVQKGAYENMISNAVRFSTGYLQIHTKGYWEDKSINNAFMPDENLNQLIGNNTNVSLAVPRLESYALASSGPHTKGVEVVGIDPAQENKMNGLANKITEGSYLKINDRGILIGDGLAKYLGLNKGDTIVLLGQGYHGITAAGQFRIQGIFHYPVEQMNNNIVFLSLPEAGNLFGAPGMVTSISMMLHHPERLDNTVHSIRSLLHGNMEVMEWQKMNKTLLQEIKGDNSGGIIMIGILYVVVAFGVFGTILMMTMERKKEFSVMIAIGMRRLKLMMIVFIETFFLGCLGIFSGIILILPVVIYFHNHPIPLTGSAAAVYQQFGIEAVIPASLNPSIFLYQGITVLCIALASALYPLWYVGRFPIL